MTSGLEQSIAELRRRAARGDFAGARRLLAEVLDRARHPGEGVPTWAHDDLSRHARTLEVLESIDVIRRMLREGNHRGAADAASSISGALSGEDYSDLEIVGSAMALLDRADELGRQAASGSGGARGEIPAFVDMVGLELNELGQSAFDAPMRALFSAENSGSASASTLGDLLSRKPWRSGLRRAVEAVPEPRPQEGRTGESGVAHFSAVSSGESPVIGRILIEQEAPVRAAPLPQTGDAGQGQDVFDVIGRAAMRQWHVVVFSALFFSVMGWLITMLAPPKYQSLALLQKAPQSTLRAPITGSPGKYVPSLPRMTIIKMASLASFHERVAANLRTTGWTPGEGGESKTFSLTSAKIAQALEVSVDNTRGESYYIEFKATYGERETARAIAGTAALTFKQYHYDLIVGEARKNQQFYEAREARLGKELKEIEVKRAAEFEIEGGSVAIAFTIRKRLVLLSGRLSEARSRGLVASKDLKAAEAEAEEFAKILAATSIHIEGPAAVPGADPELDALRRQLGDVSKELLELDRKRADYGPKHPIHNQIRELREDRAYLQEQIEDIRSRDVRNKTDKIPNPKYSDALANRAHAVSKLKAAQLDMDYWSDGGVKYETELRGLRDSLAESDELQRRETKLRGQQSRNEIVLEELSSVISSADRELTLVQPAIPATALERRVLLGIAIGLIFGLVIGIAAAIAILRRRQAQQA